MERGLGPCSQAALALEGLLEEKGIHAEIIGLRGHVVTQVEIAPGEKWILDPNMGVVIPHSLAEIEMNPELIIPVYSNLGETVVNSLLSIYGTADNATLENAKSYFGTKYYFYEKTSEILIWAIPFFFCVPFAIYQYKKIRP